NLATAMAKFFDDPAVTVVVKQINSRRVYITGQVAKTGLYGMTDHMTVVTLITVAGGLPEFAKKDDIGIFRMVNGKIKRIRFNFDDYSKGKHMEQDIELKPGDKVIVR